MANNFIVTIRSNEMDEANELCLMLDNLRDSYRILCRMDIHEESALLAQYIISNYDKMFKCKARTYGAWYFTYYLSCLMRTDEDIATGKTIFDIMTHLSIKELDKGVSNIFDELVVCDCQDQHSDYDGREGIKCEYDQLFIADYIILMLISKEFGYEELNPELCTLLKSNVDFYLFTVICEDGDYQLFCTATEMRKFEKEGYDEEDDSTHMNVLKQLHLTIESDLNIKTWTVDDIECIKNSSGDIILQFERKFIVRDTLLGYMDMFIERKLSKSYMALHFNNDDKFGLHHYRYNIFVKSGAILARMISSNKVAVKYGSNELWYANPDDCVLYASNGRLKDNIVRIHQTPYITNQLKYFNDIYDMIIKFVDLRNPASQVCDLVLGRVKSGKVGRLTLQSLALIRVVRNIVINDSDGSDIFSWDGSLSYGIKKSSKRRVLRESWFEHKESRSLSNIEYLFKI